MLISLYICHVLLEKSNLRIQRNNTLNLESKEVRDQFLENLNFSIKFSEIFILSIFLSSINNKTLQCLATQTVS